MNQIEANFQQESTTTVCQLIAGLGGIGKTSLAVEFASIKLPDYELIAFLSSETIETLKDSLLSLADYLAFTGDNAGEKLAALQRWLISPDSGRWLLLVDNVDEFEVLRALQSILPFSVNHGQILIASRYPHKLAFAQTVCLKDFTPEESLRFFCNRLETNSLENTEETHALSLAEKLGYLPLALEQAIALIAHDGLSFSDYIQEYDSNRALLLADGAPYAHLSDPALKQVAVTWNMNFHKVFEKNTLLRPFMHLCAFMSTEVIPLKWISEGLSQTVSDFSNYTTESSVKRFVSPLSDYSLIQMAQKNQGFQLHRMVLHCFDFLDQIDLEILGRGVCICSR